MKRILAEGKHLRLVIDGRWEYAERTSASGAVCIIAVTEDKRVLIVEQYRAALAKNVLELPAGLAGDTPEAHGEQLATAAQRELLEETGYSAQRMDFLTEGPVSPGLSNEVISFFRATGLTRAGEGGGDHTEEITVHEVPLTEAKAWLNERARAGSVIDPKIFVGLFFTPGSGGC